MGTYASSTGFFTAVSVVSLICGVIVVIAALVLRVHPEEHVMWGIVIVVFSAVSFVGMGGYFVGAAFGILGGALALTYKPIRSFCGPIWILILYHCRNDRWVYTALEA